MHDITLRQGRRHEVDWGGHVHPTFARGRSRPYSKDFFGLHGGLGDGSPPVGSRGEAPVEGLGDEKPKRYNKSPLKFRYFLQQKILLF